MKTHRSSKPELATDLSRTSRVSSPSLVSSASEETGDLWDLGWVLGVLRRRLLLILQITISTTILASGFVIISSSLTEPKYEGHFQLQVEPASAEAKLSRSYLSAQETERQGNSESINLEQISTLDYETQIRILTSSTLMEPIIKQIQIHYPEITYESLINQLKVERVKITKDGKELGAKLLDVTYTAKDPQEIIFVLNNVSQAYLKYSLKERQTNIRQGVKFIDEQLPILRERVNNLQSQIEELRLRNNLMDPEQQGQDFFRLLTHLKTQQVDNLTKLSEAQARYQALQQQLRGDNATAVLSEFPSFQKLFDQYQELEAQLATTSARLGEDAPPMQSLRLKRENLRNVLNREAEQILARTAAQVEIAKAQQQTIAQVEQRLNQQFQQLPAIARQYALLKQELQIATATLDRFLSKSEALNIDAAQQEIPWELTSTPALTRNVKGEPINLASKNKRLLLALSGVLSALLAVGIAFLIEILQDILYTSDEVKQISQFPLLGTIPTLEASSFVRLSSDSLLITSENSIHSEKDAELKIRNIFPFWTHNSLSKQSNIAAFTESFNLIYSNIERSRTELPIQSLVVSSPNSQDGRSTIAIYLAKAAAMVGKKVLLVDSDMRSPRLHYYLKLDNMQGLSDLLEFDLDWHEIVQSSHWEDNLFILTAGKPQSKPIKILSSSKLKDLMQKFATQFDFIIYDSPPLLNYADLSLIGSQVDGIILVARLGKTKRAVLAHTLAGFKISHLPVIGLVANGVA